MKLYWRKPTKKVFEKIGKGSSVMGRTGQGND